MRKLLHRIEEGMDNLKIKKKIIHALSHMRFNPHYYHG